MYSVSEQPTVTLRTHCVPYCLNIHRGESLSEVCENIRVHARRVKAEVSPRTIYPLGMRLSACAADELTRNPS